MDKKIRNFCIIAHIDAGKSTLSDRFLELTGTIESRKMREQVLDQMDLERERGITIKLQPVRMEWQGYILNLIDTPGHMDFYLEVKRSLGAVEGALLLIDGIKGIQAQTLSNLGLARELGLKIIPIINKIDLQNSRVPEIERELLKMFSDERIYKISAKIGTGVKELLENLPLEIPAPDNQGENVVFDSFYDSFHGVVNFIRIKNKPIKGRVGVFKPEMTAVAELNSGEIGYFLTGQKESRVQNTANPLVFASVFFEDFNALNSALLKLRLNDQALTIELASWPSLGKGFRCGFLGLLHMEIVLERLKREFGIVPIVTSPQVEIRGDKEPWVKLEIITPREYLGRVIRLLSTIRGEHKEMKSLSEERLVVVFLAPLADIIVNFYDRLKSATSGFASLGYILLDWRPSGLIQLDILLAGQKIPGFSRLISQDKLFPEAKKFVELLVEIIPRQNFLVPVQAVVGSKVIARGDIKAYRKDVIAGLYGGDYTRKKKLLERQKKGKKKMAKIGKINLSRDVFIKTLKY